MNSETTRVLVVDDEPQIRRFLSTSLTAHGYSVVEASGGEEAMLKLGSERPDLVILDLGLPDVDGIEVLRRVRQELNGVSVIILSARERENDKVQALDLGADDYITKPFGVGELMARVRTALRHKADSGEESSTYRCKGLTVDLDKRKVYKGEEEIRLTPKEWDILALLAKHAGRVATHQYLLREIWGPTFTNETHYLRVYVGQLRQKIEDDASRPEFILTESGVGYRLCEPEDVETGKASS